MDSKRRGAGRRAAAGRGRFRSVEALEPRQLLTATISPWLMPYVPTDLYVRNPATNTREGSLAAAALYRAHDVDGALVSNQGKIVTGMDRQGNQWTITVHGPGYAIVTDTTPNDGHLDDDIDTIQIVGSNLNTTYVTGSTTASAQTLTSGTVRFNRLIAADGVNSVVLNGFDLTSMVTPASANPTGILLLGGARALEFHDVIGLFDTDANPTPYLIQIGQTNHPSKVKTSIKLNSIYNSVFSTASTEIPRAPQTTPSVQFVVNGVLQSFDIVSASQSAFAPNYVIDSQQQTRPFSRRATTVPTDDASGGAVTIQTSINEWRGYPVSGPPPAAYQYQYNVVGTTGRTSLQTVAINRLNVRGSARNFTAQRDTAPFTSADSGLSRLGSATFGGNADGVALDVNGPIRRLRFNRGLGDPTGVFTATAQVPGTELNPETRAIPLPATMYGIPEGSTGYGAAGLIAGAVRARNIDGLSARAANLSAIYAQRPDLVPLWTQNTPTPTTVPGMAMTNSSITTTGSIGHANVDGNLLNSAIASGYDYQAHLQGLQAARRGARIAAYKQNGDLINSTVTASADLNPTQPVVRDGSITGVVAGKAYHTGGRDALGQSAAGVFARRKAGRLPIAPNSPIR